MNDKIQKVLENLIPYVVLGFLVALFFTILFFFSYLFIWGLIIGGIIWAISTIKKYFYPEQKPAKKGRVIEHEDKKDH